MDLMSFKEKLREKCKQDFKEEELCQWYDPLSFLVNEKEKELHIIFPHTFFAAWFIKHKYASFAECCEKYLSLKASYDTQLVANTSLNNIPLNKESSLLLNEQIEQEMTDKSVFSVIGRIPLQDHTFSSFFVNKKNDFPLAAAKEAIESIESPLYFPFVIIGQSGTGKTHVLEAMINMFIKKYKDKYIFYGDIKEFVQFIQSKNKNKLDLCQAYFIDDAHTLADTNLSIQKQVSSHFDHCYRENKLVVLSFDSSPLENDSLLPQLQQRIISGLLIKLKKPDIHIRRLYVERTNELFDLGLSKQVILSFAQNYTDFRSIIGALTRIKAYKLLVNDDIKSFENVFEEISEKNKITVQKILYSSAKFHNISENDILGKNKEKKTCLARQQAMYLCRELLGFSLAQIGYFFGKRDHSSVIYSLKKMKVLLDSNKDMHNELQQIKKMCTKKDEQLSE